MFDGTSLYWVTFRERVGSLEIPNIVVYVCKFKAVTYITMHVVSRTNFKNF